MAFCHRQLLLNLICIPFILGQIAAQGSSGARRILPLSRGFASWWNNDANGSAAHSRIKPLSDLKELANFLGTGKAHHRFALLSALI